MQAQLVKKESESSSDAVTFFFKPNTAFRFTAGQFIELTLSDSYLDETNKKRWFTLSSSPSEPLLALTTRITGKRSAFKGALTATRVGDSVMISQPMGDFVLPKDPTISLLFIAGGIGITPFRSIIKWLDDTHEKRRISLIHMVPNKNAVVFSEVFSKYACDYRVDHQEIAQKRVIDIVPTETKPSDGSLIYISGPEPMAEDLTKRLLANNYVRQQIITDYFPGYSGI